MTFDAIYVKFVIVIEFRITKKSKKSNARLGILKTPHGVIKTPAFVPVATQATVKTLTIDQALDTKSQLFISNTFHLHLKPGEDIVKKAGGLHDFMRWPKPLMTDSGGFQVFSLGFGRDLEVGKVVKFFPDGQKGEEKVKLGQKSKNVKITEDGVTFRSPIDGSELFIGPEESMKIQAKLGADIIYAFDECTPPLATKEYLVNSLERTHRWLLRCIKAHKSDQALYGIVQGSHYEDLRKQACDFMRSVDLPGYGIGGDLGHSREDMKQILRWTIPYLEDNKPRHLLGVGHLEDMEMIIQEGVDTFDCIAPSHYARHGIAFTRKGRLDMRKRVFLTDHKSLDIKCGCYTCKTYSRDYICHLFRAKELSGMTLLTIHNIFYFNEYVAEIRKKIRDGKI